MFLAKPKILIAITVLAAWLRFTGLCFGIPGTFRPDEEYLINAALGFQSDWNPHFAIYPAAQMYLQRAALWIWAAAHRRSSDFPAFYQGDNYPTAYVVGRVLSALMGTATVPAIYLAGAPVLGINASLAASAIVAVATLHVLNSKFATTDVPAAFWITLALAMVLRIVGDPRMRSYLGAGFFAGLAMATKYPAAAVAVGILAAHLCLVRKGVRSPISLVLDKRLYIAALTMIGTFFCATPYILLDLAQTVHDYEYQKGFILHGTSAAGYGWHWLLLRAMPDSFGVSLEILMAAGLIWSLIRPRRETVPIVAFLAATCGGMLNSHWLFYRYLLIPLPAMALLAGILIRDMRMVLKSGYGSSNK
jgi:4-amino-4-deoxy-L-arabinose transferase-like glycosyltransferase